LKAFDYSREICIAQPQNNHTDASPLRERCDLAEIEIEGDDGPPLRGGLDEYLAIGKRLKTLFPKVNGIRTLRAQPVCYADIDTHVDEKPLRVYDAMTSSSASHAAYSNACWISAGSMSG